MEESHRGNRRYPSRLGTLIAMARSIPDSIALDAYAAIHCPVKVQNTYDATIDLSKAEMARPFIPSQRSAASKDNRDEIMAFLGNLEGSVDCRRSTFLDSCHATNAALEAGEKIILYPTFRIDTQHHRRTGPSILIRADRRDDGRYGYYPVHISFSPQLERYSAPTGRISALSDPVYDSSVPLLDGRRRTGRDHMLLILAHYWRLLESYNAQASEPIGGLIGTDTVHIERDSHAVCHDRSADSRCIVWCDLSKKSIHTFSKTARGHWKMRSALQRYDHEFSFRLAVAANALDLDKGAKAMVQPIYSYECDDCRWWTICSERMSKDDLSVQILKSRLDIREIAALRSLGISDVNDLAQADLNQLMDDFLPLVGHRPGAEERLTKAAHRARMIAAHICVEKITSDPLVIPRSRIEIDFDLETSADQRIYLWGFLVNDRNNPHEEPYYHPFVRFADLDDREEIDLAVEAISWLSDICSQYEDVTIYHYSDYELVQLKRLATRSSHPILKAGYRLLRDHSCDLFAIVKKNFFGAYGLGLKAIATTECGFSWRDDAPSGLNSQQWFIDAVHAPTPSEKEASQKRLLEYNEDDTRATVALRSWLSRYEDPSTASKEAMTISIPSQGSLNTEMS